MIVASGFVEVNEEKDAEKVAEAIRGRGFEIREMSGEKIVYLLEREKAADLRPQIDALKEVDGVRSVYLAYYSLEGADREAVP